MLHTMEMQKSQEVIDLYIMTFAISYKIIIRQHKMNLCCIYV